MFFMGTTCSFQNIHSVILVYASILLFRLILVSCYYIIILTSVSSVVSQPGHLAMETLLSLTSKQAGDWFKEDLRTFGGLDHIIDTGESIPRAFCLYSGYMGSYQRTVGKKCLLVCQVEFFHQIATPRYPLRCNTITYTGFGIILEIEPIFCSFCLPCLYL